LGPEIRTTATAVGCAPVKPDERAKIVSPSSLWLWFWWLFSFMLLANEGDDEENELYNAVVVDVDADADDTVDENDKAVEE
jgi:hypothetical protein